MPQFKGVDFYGLDGLLSDEERMVRDTVREWVDDRVLPVIGQHYREGTFPSELIPELSRLGAFGSNLRGYGCAGLGSVAYGLLMQELERGDSGLRSFVSVQGALAMYAMDAFGTDAQKERWLPPMARGEKLGCFGLTEPDFGSNPAGLATRARKTSQGYVIQGNKMWITSGSLADVAVVWAKIENDPGVEGASPDAIRGFLVEKGVPGFSAQDIHGKLSLRASVTSELLLDHCEVGEDALLPAARGLKAPLRCLNQARYGIAWGAVGAAMACYEEARQYAASRIQFGRPIGSFQLVQKKLAEMLTEITKAQLLVLRLAQLKDQGQARHPQISMAKMNNVETALGVARTARDILGAAGILDECQCFRHLCNLESVKTYEGTHDIHLLILGEEITGIPAFA
ncbi:MAG: acyl-CoA dehydrogenase family protein [Planctomycetes bacterium]|nr:acyl-CoA dehydrogenase family protein [Planctomycetota bacterium]